jgi:hypothetical protein
LPAALSFSISASIFRSSSSNSGIVITLERATALADIWPVT